MASRANPEAAAPTTKGPHPAPGTHPAHGARLLRHGSPQTDAIAGLDAERRSIRRRVQIGTGLSGADDNRLRALDAQIDRLWAELRRERLPQPQIAVRPAARPAARR